MQALPYPMPISGREGRVLSSFPDRLACSRELSAYLGRMAAPAVKPPMLIPLEQPFILK